MTNIDNDSENFSYRISKDDEGWTVKALLRHRLNFSTRLLRKIQNDGSVLCSGAEIKMNGKPSEGDLIEVLLPRESSNFLAEDIPIDVLYEDADILIINKQAGLVVHPTKGHPCHTIANGVMNYMISKGESYKIRFVNRLDMDTTGVLLIGKNAHTQDNFTKQAGEGRIQKEYLAIVCGTVEADEGTIDLPITKDREDELRRVVRSDGYPSVTHYRVVERFSKNYTMVRILIDTGRTHQIRVHMEYIGHPVLGDVLYGRGSPFLTERQMLHAAALSFKHPRSGAGLKIEAPMPGDMERTLGKLR